MNYDVMKTRLKVCSWVTGNEVIAKNVNANIPVSLSWFFRLSWPSFAFLPQLNSLIQVCSDLIQFSAKASEAALACGFVVQRQTANEGSLAFAEKLN